MTGKVQKFRMREASVQELGLEHAARVKMARPARREDLALERR